MIDLLASVLLLQESGNPGRPAPRLSANELLAWEETLGGRDPDTGHVGSVRDLAVHADGHALVSAGEDHRIRLWQLESKEAPAIWSGHDGAVSAVAWVPGTEQVLSGSEDRSLRLWNAKTGSSTDPWSGHEKPVTAVAVSPNGSRALSGDDDGRLILWDVVTQEPVRNWAGHEQQRDNGVTQVTFTGDGQKALTSSWYGKTVALWDLAQEAPLWADTHWKVTGLALHPTNPERALTAGVYDDLVLWDLTHGKQLSKWRPKPPPEFGEVQVAFTEKADRVLSAGWTDTLILWDVAEAKEIDRLLLDEGPTSLCLFGDHAYVGTGRGTIAVVRIVPPSSDN